MAAISGQSRSPETERNLTRRHDSDPWRAEIGNFGPFSMMRRLSEEMDRVFSSTFGLSRGGSQTGMWSPAVEVRERDGNLDITAELPGMRKEDVQVESTEEGLIIQGERRQEREENQGGYRRSERSYGHFYRLIPLPQGAQPDKAKAEFKDGLLQVHVPIPENKPQSRQIPIST